MARYELPISDPTPELSPTAARILEAAKRVLARDGFRALTFERIAAEAGENPALIRYHFGSKAGLVTMLIDSVMYLESVELIEQLTRVPPGEKRRRALFRLHERYARDTAAYQMFYEIIPHIMRDEELRPHLRDLFDWYRKLDAWALGAGEVCRRRRSSSRWRCSPWRSPTGSRCRCRPIRISTSARRSTSGGPSSSAISTPAGRRRPATPDRRQARSSASAAATMRRSSRCLSSLKGSGR